jgi:hypothetical protein
VIYTHNHLFSGTFSLLDMDLILDPYLKLREIEVVEPRGYWTLTKSAPFTIDEADDLINEGIMYIKSFETLMADDSCARYVIDACKAHGIPQRAYDALHRRGFDTVADLGVVNQIIGKSNGRLSLDFTAFDDNSDAIIMAEITFCNALNDYANAKWSRNHTIKTEGQI